MKLIAELSSETLQQLEMLYEEIMWLRARPNITSSVARSWYTHACSERLKKHIRRFSGFISEAAATDKSPDLRLEHHLRMQTVLTQLVEHHHRDQIRDPEEFISTICRYEEVHIVTKDENYAAMRAKGDYDLAEIQLLAWDTLTSERRFDLWKRMLRGRVSNHLEFRPGSDNAIEGA